MMILMQLRKYHYRTLIVLLSIAAFIVAQALMIHTHSSKHELHSQGGDAIASGHFHHHAALHLIVNSPGNDHHDMQSEIDPPVNSDSKNVKVGQTLPLLLLAILLLVFAPALAKTRWQGIRNPLFNKRNLLIRPPLRAPPFWPPYNSNFAFTKY